MRSKKHAAKSPPRRRILLVDDHPLMRRGQEEMINREPDLEVCGEAGTARETMIAITRLRPDMVVLDLGLPDKEGIELLKDIHALHPRLPVLIVSLCDETLYATRVLQAGGRGYVMKTEAPDKLMAAIRAVLQGQIAVSRQVSSNVLEAFAVRKARALTGADSRLTDRELDVLQLFGTGWSKNEIADRLHIAPKTVDVHRARIKQKLGFTSNPEFLRHAIRWASAQS